MSRQRIKIIDREGGQKRVMRAAEVTYFRPFKGRINGSVHESLGFTIPAHGVVSLTSETVVPYEIGGGATSIHDFRYVDAEMIVRAEEGEER